MQKRIKHYIVTYNNPIWIKCVESIIDTPTYHDRQIIVVNNHSNFEVPEHLIGLVRVIDNQSRPDFSTGHLARNWNECLIDGFRDLSNSDADIVICSQNDAEFEPDYLDRLIALHERFDLVTHGPGDNCISYTAQAVRRVGLWDERFCNIGFQEADYFLRSVKWLGDRCAINDEYHGRSHNPSQIVVKDLVTGYYRDDEAHFTSLRYHAVSRAVLDAKWGEAAWHEGEPNVLAEPLIPSAMMYPYFESQVETLKYQNFILPPEESPDDESSSTD